MGVKNASYRMVLSDRTITVSLTPEVIKASEAENLLQTKKRVSSVFTAMLNQGILDNIKNDEKTLIVFEYGSQYILNAGMTIEVSQTSPQKYSIEISAIKNLSDELYAQIKESKENNTSKTDIFFIEDFVLPYYVVKTAWDIILGSIKAQEKTISLYLSSRVIFKNSTFKEKYVTDVFARTLYTRLEQAGLIENYIDNSVLYITAIDEGDGKMCMLELSLKNTGPDGTNNSIDILVNNFTKAEYSAIERKLQVAGIKSYGIGLTLKKVPTVKKKLGAKGLKIVKKKIMRACEKECFYSLHDIENRYNYK